MSNLKRISYTRVQSYLTCKKMYNLRYNENIVPIQPSQAISRGSALHECLENLPNPNYKEISVGSEEMEEYLRDIVEEYKWYYGEEDASHSEVKREEPFEVLLPNSDIVLTGKIDAMFVDGAGLRCVMDTKTFSRRPDRIVSMLSLQSAIYVYAYKQLTGSYPDYFMWNYICNKHTSYPKVLKNGNLAIPPGTVTEYKYRKFCEETGREVDREFLGMIHANRMGFFYRVQCMVDIQYVEALMRQLVALVHEMDETNVYFPKYSNDCAWCEYRHICVANSMSIPIDEISAKYYRKNELFSTNNGIINVEDEI